MKAFVQKILCISPRLSWGKKITVLPAESSPYGNSIMHNMQSPLNYIAFVYEQEQTRHM